MYEISIAVTGNIAKVTNRPKRITAGTVGLPVTFTFDDQWKGLNKTAVFQAGAVELIVDGIGEKVSVPPKVLRKADEYLIIGVYGLNADGSIAIPTTWANIGYIELGVDIDGSADDGTPLPVWKQILTKADNAVNASTKALSQSDAALENTDKLMKYVGVSGIPLVKFDMTHNMLDVSGDMVLPDGTPWSFVRNPVNDTKAPGQYYTTLNQVQGLYDSLCKKYQHLWTKIKVVDWVGEQYPSYAQGIPMGKNHFDRDRVYYAFKEDEITLQPIAENLVSIGWNGGAHVDILTGKTGTVDGSTTTHRISKDDLPKMLWLPKGDYTMSYTIHSIPPVLDTDGQTNKAYGVIRACRAKTNSDGSLVTYVDDKGNQFYDAELITSRSYTDDEKGKNGATGARAFDTFSIGEHGAYISFRRTTTYSMTISDVQIAKGKPSSSSISTIPYLTEEERKTNADYIAYIEYSPYLIPAFKYKVEDGVCTKIIRQGDPDYNNSGLETYYYKPTPAYETFMYKFSFTNVSMHSAHSDKTGEPLVNCKKSILLTSSVNGDEKAAPFNSYLFCKRLCEVFAEKTADGDYYYDDDYYKFAQAFDVYIIPCVNGYGLYHNTRWNANGIQIDRNFDTGELWVGPDKSHGGVTFLPGTQDFPGTTPDSEFETRLIEKVTEKLKPDLAFDLHNYTSKLKRQFYTNVAKREWMPLLYQSCVDCSIAFKRKFPQYFGKNIELVRDSDDYRLDYEAKNGEVTTWWRVKGNVFFPALIEVSQTINYNNGVWVGSSADVDEQGNIITSNNSGIDPHGSSTFSVAEYTVRNQLMRYGQFVMQHKPEDFNT